PPSMIGARSRTASLIATASGLLNGRPAGRSLQVGQYAFGWCADLARMAQQGALLEKNYTTMLLYNNSVVDFPVSMELPRFPG
ncbi:MAG: hypothetical protein OXJ53_08620, partial [Gammaproteobacteria bacterium]|nr:hypothetical protein [Gammaproteobacteria bacterium]